MILSLLRLIFLVREMILLIFSLWLLLRFSILAQKTRVVPNLNSHPLPPIGLLNVEGENVQAQLVGLFRFHGYVARRLEAGDAERVQMETALREALLVGGDPRVPRLVGEHALCRKTRGSGVAASAAGELFMLWLHNIALF